MPKKDSKDYPQYGLRECVDNHACEQERASRFFADCTPGKNHDRLDEDRDDQRPNHCLARRRRKTTRPATNPTPASAQAHTIRTIAQAGIASMLKRGSTNRSPVRT